MTALADVAVDALATLVNAALAPNSPTGVLVTPRRISPTGLGGYVSPHPDPVGEVSGARIEASVRVTVQASDVGTLHTDAAALTQTMLGFASATTAREAGLLKLGMEDPVTDVREVQGNRVEQDLRFTVVYEFLQVPEEGGGIIEEIPLNLKTADGTAWLDLAFSPASLALFDVVDDPRATTDTPSAWAVDPEGRIVQTSRIRGGQATANANKPGTYLVLRPRADVPPLRDFSITTTVRSSDDGGIGVVFRYAGPDDFYFFLMDSGVGYRMLAKKIGDSFSQFSTPALDTGEGFDLDRDYELRLRVASSTFTVFLDDAEMLSGSDTDLVGAGRIGFMTRDNAGGAFSELRISPP